MMMLSIKAFDRAMYCIRCGRALDDVGENRCPRCELPFDRDNTSSFISAYGLNADGGRSALASGVLSWIVMAAVLLTTGPGAIRFVQTPVVATTLFLSLTLAIHAMLNGHRAHFGHPFGSATGFAGMLLGGACLPLLGATAMLVVAA